MNLHTPDRARKLLPKWVVDVKDVKSLSRKAGSVVIVDEAAWQVAARRHQSTENLIWGGLIAVCRHNQHDLIFICQHSRQIDINIIGDADIVIFKNPSILHIRFARPELRGDVVEARRALGEKKGKANRWGMVYDYHRGARGMLQNPLPTFWSEDLSRAFQGSDMDKILKQPVKEPKKDTQKRKARQ